MGGKELITKIVIISLLSILFTIGCIYMFEVYAAGLAKALVSETIYLCSFGDGAYYITNYTADVEVSGTAPSEVFRFYVRGYNETIPHIITVPYGRHVRIYKLLASNSSFYLMVECMCRKYEVENVTDPLSYLNLSEEAYSYERIENEILVFPAVAEGNYIRIACED